MPTLDRPSIVHARVAGFAFLGYIVVGMAGINLPDQSPANKIMALLLPFAALILGVTLYALTRAQGPALAQLALVCRVAEAVTAADEAAIFFCVGSLTFAWLLVRGRLVPAALGWLGVLASALLVAVLPLQQAGLFGGPTSWSSSNTWLIWLPMLLFEVTLALWLIIKGVTLSTGRGGLAQPAPVA